MIDPKKEKQKSRSGFVCVCVDPHGISCMDEGDIFFIFLIFFIINIIINGFFWLVDGNSHGLQIWAFD